MSRRAKRKPVKRRRIWPFVAMAALLIVLWTALDQHMLFQRYRTQIAEANAQVNALDAEMKELQGDLDRRGTIGFILKYAEKYGFQRTNKTPMPVPESDLTPIPSSEETESAVTEVEP